MTPQQIEAMKMALEALKKCHYYMIDAGLPNQSLLNEAFTAYKAIEEALAQPEQEPVAWMDADGNISDNNDYKCFPIPLYTTPPQQEPVISKWVLREVYFDEDGEPVMHRSPPQRKPLTDEEIWELAANCLDSVAGRVQFARAIEAKLKEKNGV